MASTFAQSGGSALDIFTNPIALDRLDNPPHAQQHADANDAVETLEALATSLAGTPWINVKGAPYAAKGDGVTDDSSAIQSAIDAASVLGCPVFVPAGTYLLSTGLILKSDVVIVGCGDTSILKAGASIVQFCDMSATATDMGLRDLALDGNGNVVGNLLVMRGTRLTCLRVLFLDVGTSSAAQGFTTVAGGSHLVFDSCTFDGLEQLAIANSVTDVVINRCVIRNYYARGLFVTAANAGSPKRIWFTNNRVEPPVAAGNPRQPVTFTFLAGSTAYTEHVVCSGNIVQGSDTPYISAATTNGATADQISFLHVENFVISNNISYNGGDLGIFVGGSHNGVVSDNIAYRSDAAGIEIGSAASTGVHNVVVTGNVCVNNVLDRAAAFVPSVLLSGILLLEASEVTVSGNVCSDNQSTKTQDFGIGVSSSTNVIIDPSNMLEGNQTTRMSFAGTNPGLQIGTKRWNTTLNESTAVGTTGAAAAPPATPERYLKVLGADGTTLYVPAYLST